MVRSRVEEANQVRGGTTLTGAQYANKGERVSQSSAKRVLCTLEANSLSSSSYRGEREVAGSMPIPGGEHSRLPGEGVGPKRERGGAMQMRVAVQYGSPALPAPAQLTSLGDV